MKGKQIEMFKVGQRVEFKTTVRKDYSEEGRKSMISYPETGTIVKLLPKCSRGGSAKIQKVGGQTVTRRLINVNHV